MPFGEVPQSVTVSGLRRCVSSARGEPESSRIIATLPGREKRAVQGEKRLGYTARPHTSESPRGAF